MKKRMISLLLALVMCVGLFPATAQAADYTVTEVIPCKYDQVTSFSEGLAAVKLNGEWSIIDKTGKEVVSLRGRGYDSVGCFSDGLALVELDALETYDEEGYIVMPDKYGFIDKTGKEVIPCSYTVADPFSEGLALVREGDWRTGRYLFIDKTGKEVISCDKYQTVRDFSEGLALVQKGDDGDENSKNRWGFIDKTGKEVIPCQYRGADSHSFSDGLACVKNQNYRDIYIDKTGNEVLACGKYDDLFNFSEGLARAHVSRYDEALPGAWFAGKWSYINKNGEEVIPCRYDYGGAMDFSEGLAGICNDWRLDSDGKWGFIDKTGEEVIPCKYDWVYDFSEGFALVELNDRYGYVDKAGKEVVPCRYPGADDFSEELAMVADEDWDWGYISIDAIYPFSDVKSGDYYADAALWASEKGVMTGTSQTTFSPNENCTVAQILTFLWRANSSPKPTKSNPFNDVKSGDYYYADAATWAYEKGMVSGKTFGGDKPCTRSMAVTYMWKVAGSPSAKVAGFTDVAAGTEYAKAVAWAVEKGITNGTSATTFSPNDVCTRGQIVTFLHRGTK